MSTTREPQYKPTLGIIGFGVVGQAVAYGFSNHQINYYDKYKPSKTLQEVVESSDIIFICLPTPFKGKRIDLSYIEEATAEVSKYTDNTDKLLVIKSTVIPGTTRRLAKQYPNTRFAFNPEFLTEANYLEDFANADRHVVGADDNKTSLVLAALYKNQWPHIPVIQTDPTTAEMGKYAANCFLATKVMFANEMNELCESLGIEWSETKKIVVADHRVGPTHFDVTSNKGFSGKCLVPETKLLTANGIRSAADVSVGDQIFDGEKYTKISGLGKRTVPTGWKIVCRGRELKGSMDHIQMIYDQDNLVETLLSKVKVGDWVNIPKPTIVNPIKSVKLGVSPNAYYRWWPAEFTLNTKFGRILGLYLAEGCTSSKGNGTKAIYWSFGAHEEKFADEVVEVLHSYGINTYKFFQETMGTYGLSKCWMVRCRYAALNKIFEELGLGTNASNKTVPMVEPEIAKSIIGGWLDGDGSYYDGTIMGYSKSLDLISGMDTLLLSLGICAQIGNNGHSIKISMRSDVEEVCSWTKRFTFDGTRYVRNHSYASPSMRSVSNGWKVKVKKSEMTFATNLISLETESHLYTANNILTHNCFPKDMIALLGLFEDLKVDSSMLSAVWEKNLRIRKVHDWEDIPFVKTESEEDN